MRLACKCPCMTNAEKVAILERIERESAPIVRQEAHMSHEELLRAEGYDEAMSDVREMLNDLRRMLDL